MEVGRFYFIKNDYFNKYDYNHTLLSNKEDLNGVISYRPCFFAFEDKHNSNIYWCVPISSKVNKFEKIYEHKIQKEKERGNNNPDCKTIRFGKVLGEKRAFLIQNIFPVTQDYIDSVYIDKAKNEEVILKPETQEDIIKNARDIIKLTYSGHYKPFADVISIYNNLVKELNLINGNDDIILNDNTNIVDNSRMVLDITGKTQKDFVSEIENVLKQGIRDVYSTDKWINWLNFNNKIYRYSARNRLLIMLQMPDASYVASMSDWNKKFNRYVIKGQGSQGLKILKPTEFRVKAKVNKLDEEGNPVLDENGKPLLIDGFIKKQGYIPVSVYDISQTEGEPIPKLIDELSGDYKDTDKLLEAIEKTTGIKIDYEDLNGEKKGYFSQIGDDKKIVIKKGMSDEQTIKTAIHEMAHSMLHCREAKYIKDTDFKELEAESVAYLVCQRFGIDTSQYSFGYLAGWSNGKADEMLNDSLDAIINTAQNINDNLNYYLKRYNLSQCQNPEACEKYLKYSKNLTLCDKDTYNSRVQAVDSISNSKIFIEIGKSECSDLKKGEIYSLSELDSKFPQIEEDTINFFKERGYVDCYDKLRFTVYYEKIDTNGNKNYSTIEEQYEVGTKLKNNISDYLLSFKNYNNELSPIINDMQHDKKLSKSR